MTHPPGGDRKSEAAAQASLWLERLERTLREDDVKRLREWLGTPLHRELIIERCKLWHGPEILAVLEKLIPHDVAVSNEPPRRRRMRFILAGAIASSIVVLSIFMLLGGTQWFDDRGHPSAPRIESRYRTPLGGRQQVNLPDGTVLAINTSSSIYVNYGAKLRMISVVRGEVLFDIPRDAAREFQLSVGGRVIETERARFSVRQIAPDYCEITIVAGKVKIRNPRRSADKTPDQLRDSRHYTYGEATLVAPDGGVFGPGWQSVETLSEAEIQARLAWQKGLIVFADEPLPNALAEIARYVPREFVLTDDSLRDARLSGEFRAGDVDAVLLALHEMLHIESQLDAQGRIVLRASNRS